MNLEVVPQWVIITNLQKGMFPKRAVNTIVSSLGSPLHDEMDTVLHKLALRTFSFPRYIKTAIREEDDRGTDLSSVGDARTSGTGLASAMLNL